MNSTINLRFPIGEMPSEKHPTSAQLEQWILTIEQFPSTLQEVVKDLSVDQLNWCYRAGGWSIKQLVHHCADSHMNSFIRFKLALTEEVPAIKPYFEDRWAELSDSLDDNIEDSLLLLRALHRKWVKLLKSLSQEELNRTFVHPEHGTSFSLVENIGIYAWHCNHHLAHVRLAIEAEGGGKG